MDALAGASVLGFGTHRWTGVPEQLHALDAALDHGCTLVDVVVPAGHPHEPDGGVQDAVGRALAHRLADVRVVTTTSLLDPAALTQRVRVAAARLRRDRLDVLLLDGLEQLLTGPDEASSAERLQGIFATCESLADRGELGAYGLATSRPPTGAFGLARLVALARTVRRVHRFGVLQAPCELLLRRDGGAPDLVRQAHRDGLATLGTRPLPVWPSQGAAPMATCQQYLLQGVDHVVVDPGCVDQVRSVAPLLPGRLALAANAGSLR